jgi:hypothetical protein
MSDEMVRLAGAYFDSNIVLRYRDLAPSRLRRYRYKYILDAYDSPGEQTLIADWAALQEIGA